MKTTHFVRYSWLLFVSLFLVFSSTHCSEPEPTNECKFDQDCKTPGTRCIFNDPTCQVGNLSCQGTCKSYRPNDNNNNNNSNCACKRDEDCNYPFEGCAGCKCYKRNVIVCKSDKDCGRGRLCVGDPGKRVCEVRTTCSKDTDCLNGYVCREQSCCNVNSGRCPGQCKTGSGCQDNLDCLVCGLECVNGQCAKGGPSCSGVKCTKDTDCTQCGGKCEAGYCKVNNTPNCVGKPCSSNNECAGCGDGTCSQGQCQ